MQDKLINQEIANLDYNSIAALQQKRTLAFVNHFVITTVQFLNNFSKECEQKLMNFEDKLEKIDATMVLLQTKLSSIPEVNDLEIPKQVEPAPPSQEEVNSNTEDKSPEPESVPEEKIDTPVNPEYMRFVKMVQVGVPLQAVKLKLTLEGLDPTELDKILAK
ncbi:WASH complex subunit 3 [Zerene cesonia]|uniref:WASH complex subunit 3 n=1 Tax=Zerene cesonia TaxID=33412 RepID=UPI0018E51776|nr:WASH complex subunit 3 [Zerene cesonia]